jgi:hypothetical protein
MILTHTTKPQLPDSPDPTNTDEVWRNAWQKLVTRLSNSSIAQFEGRFSSLEVSESTPNISDSRLLGLAIRRVVKIVHQAIQNSGEFHLKTK